MGRGLYRRTRLERAISDAGYRSHEAFGHAIGYSGWVVGRWVGAHQAPCPDARRAISRVLELSPGADCDEVVESDLDWLLEPVEVLEAFEWPDRCDG